METLKSDFFFLQKTFLIEIGNFNIPKSLVVEKMRDSSFNFVLAYQNNYIIGNVLEDKISNAYL